MSVPVDPNELAAAVAEQSLTAYLITTGPDDRPRVNQVAPVTAANRVSVTAGRSAARNAVDRPAVTLVWPPADEGGFTLIADGDAVVADGSGPGDPIEIVVTGAVLHRSS